MTEIFKIRVSCNKIQSFHINKYMLKITAEKEVAMTMKTPQQIHDKIEEVKKADFFGNMCADLIDALPKAEAKKYVRPNRRICNGL